MVIKMKLKMFVGIVQGGSLGIWRILVDSGGVVGFCGGRVFWYGKVAFFYTEAVPEQSFRCRGVGMKDLEW